MAEKKNFSLFHPFVSVSVIKLSMEYIRDRYKTILEQQENIKTIGS